MPSPLRLGVVIPAYNEAANIANLIHFLRCYPAVSSHAPIELDIWVDVSGSTDATPMIVAEIARQWSGLHVIDTGERQGLLRALTQLLRVARGDLILRMDADVQVGPEALDSMIRTLQRTGASIVGPRIIPAECSSIWVSRLSRAEFDLHHLICLESPKTTVVQLFRSVPVDLREDSGVEDQELQSQLESSAGPAAYDPEAAVFIVPAANFRDYLAQRVRTVHHLLIHARRGYAAPSTARAGPVARALLEAIRHKTIPLSDLALFLSAEAWARVAARWRAWTRSESIFAWEPLGDTKSPNWQLAAPGSSAIRAAEDPIPPLLR